MEGKVILKMLYLEKDKCVRTVTMTLQQTQKDRIELLQ